MSPMPAQKPGRSKQDYGTPKEFLAAVRALLGITDFDIDLACSHENRVVRHPRYYTEHENALVQEWTVGDGWNWLNPPFERIEPWVRKAWAETGLGAQTAVLVPAGVGANWWRDWVHNKAADVHFLNGRLAFLGTPRNPKTGKPDPYPKDCALLLYHNHQRPTAYHVWTWQNDIPEAEAA